MPPAFLTLWRLFLFDKFSFHFAIAYIDQICYTIYVRNESSLTFSSLEAWEAATALRVAAYDVGHLITPTEELKVPNRQDAVVGVDQNGNRITAVVGLSAELRGCAHCDADIPIGSEHIITRKRAQNVQDGERLHEHYASDCFETDIVPLWKNTRLVPLDKAQPRTALPRQ